MALSERAVAAVPIERDAVYGLAPIEIPARVAARMGDPDRAIAALQKLLSIPCNGALAAACRSLLRCSGSIRCSIRSGMIRASRNSAKRSSHRVGGCVAREFERSIADRGCQAFRLSGLKIRQRGPQRLQVRIFKRRPTDRHR